MFVSESIEKKYSERLSRYVCAMRRGTPDRIPVRFLFQEVAGKYAGYTNQEIACDYNLAFDATRKIAEDLNVDAAMLNAIWSTYSVAKAASWKYMALPGVDIGLESASQFWEPSSESEMFLHKNEYEEFIKDPTAFLINKWMARSATRVKPAGSHVDFGHNYSLMAGAMAYNNYMHAFGPAAFNLKYKSGVVSANSGMIKAPLDIFADKLRGFIPSVIDSVENPKKLLRACEALMPHILNNALHSADPDKLVPITIWAHRGCVPFYNKKTFDNIYWPTLKPIFQEIISKGRQILFYGEGNWEAHYDSLRELPAGGIIYHLDKGDPALAAKKLHDKFAISGGMSYDILARGFRQDVREHLKDLFDILKGDGGYILDASALMMHDIKPENLREAVEYTLEHGVYSSGHNSNYLPVEKPDEISVIPHGSRPAGVCIPWQEESASYGALGGDIDLVKNKWEAADSDVYYYVWTSLLW